MSRKLETAVREGLYFSGYLVVESGNSGCSSREGPEISGTRVKEVPDIVNWLEECVNSKIVEHGGSGFSQEKEEKNLSISAGEKSA